MFRILSACVVAGLIAVSAVDTARAGNSHTYNGYAHGMYDAADDDYFFHPAVHCDGCGSLAPNTVIVSTYRYNVGRVHREECSYCFNLHYDYYPAVRECNYYVNVFVRTYVSEHVHTHHYYCGGTLA
jgi:hypothetical protein